MATKYCDHGLYGTPVAGGTVPSASEDGNGAAKTTAAMATLVVTFTGVPAATGAITIAGITFTAVASGATGNQFNAVTDATTCALNLRNAINASTTNALKPTGAIAATAPLRNVVNATVSAGVLTVYTRCSGSEWNSVVETSTLTNATITSQWSGGSDGAWGYLINTAAIAWPTSVALINYGAWGVNSCYLGKVVAGDHCKVRSNKTIDFGITATNISIAPGFKGTKDLYLNFDIDDGTEWPADGSTPVLTIKKGNSGNCGLFPFYAQSLFLCINAKTYAGGVKSLVFETSSTGGLGTNGNLRLAVTSGCIYNSIFLKETSIGHPQFSSPNQGIGDRTVFNDCLIECIGNADGFYMIPGNYQFDAEFNRCHVSLTGATVPLTLTYLFFGTAKSQRWVFNACTCSGFVSGSRLADSSYAFSDRYVAFFKDCDFPNITNTGPYSLAAGGSLIPGTRGIYKSSRTGYRDFSFENPGMLFVEWQQQKSRPTLNAKLLDGITPWSIFAAPSTTVGIVTTNAPVELPGISKWMPAAVDLPEAVRTIKVNFLLESNLTWNTSGVSAYLTYTDTAGDAYGVDTFDPDAAALTSSSASWSTLSYDALTWVPYEFVIVTPTAVKAATEVSVILRLHRTISNVKQGIIFDPELVVT